ncbi:hypothetical protein L6164_036794 [Bauhinia variegata]|uniref:Uncharacterized protein n=1 Tax=Bauhinia variegata TaxID=167791 RepID=A0ACB9KI16_BAUVA|nr:hypothetical protein L6164_036794 [Bauhinia variegata]
MAKLTFLAFLFWACFALAFLSFPGSEARPLSNPSLMSNAAPARDSTEGSHLILPSWSSSLMEEEPHMPGRLSPGGPDPKHH